MLFEFHKSQNSKKNGSVHATYLIQGIKSVLINEPDGDVEMTSSMPEVDLSEDAPRVTVTVAAEDKLDGMSRGRNKSRQDPI